MSADRLSALLDSFDATDSTRRGGEFEEVCRWFLMNDPAYSRKLKRVWLWKDWPGRWGRDAGIDLVAETRTGEFWAIQAKAYHPKYTIKKADVDTFLAESGRPKFTYRLLIATTDHIGDNARSAIRGQQIQAAVLLRHDLAHSEVDWPASIEGLRPAAPIRKSPRLHQKEAIEAVCQGFRSADRGQLIMACGTGKTLAALWIVEALRAKRTLVLVPSLSLLRQTIREWLSNDSREVEFLPVCSDDTVWRDQMVPSVSELGLPATGDPKEVERFLAGKGPRIVFSTYQSSEVIAAAMRSRTLKKLSFDLAVADEAHRCAGPASSEFAMILGDQIRATKRLFMTATPRYFTGRIQKAGADADFEIASMDDEERFGRPFHRLTFGEAIQRDLLSDYRVLIIGVDDETYRRYAEYGRFVTRDGKEVKDARSLAAQIGLAKAMRKFDLRRTITFHSRVAAAKQFATALPDVIEWMPARERPNGQVWADHVSGIMNSSQRELRLDRLREVGDQQRGVVANARCLGEGVDVPTLDGVAFIDPKRSQVDIAQAVGRAIRKAEGKQLGTIVIPVFVDTAADPRAALEGSAFKPVWDVIRALRDHDAELGELLDELRRSLGRRSTISIRQSQKIVVDLPARVGTDFSRAFDVKLVESTTASWEFWYGLLELFVRREGHARPRQQYVEDEFRLGTWVSNQRRIHAAGRLDPERVRRLEALPGWTWDELSDKWESTFAALSRYAKREGHARPPQAYREGEFQLGTWVSVQRAFHAARRMDPERVRRLEALPGWAWDSLAEQWEIGFATLSRYAKREGHARPPVDYREGRFRLGEWVNRQRNRHAKGRLDPKRARRLDAVPGWSWNARSNLWEAAFAALRRYAKREGHARPPNSHVEGEFRLGQWVTNQRAFHRRGQVDPERVRRLEAIRGWGWDHSEQWEVGLAALSRYAKREGHARPPATYREGDFRLGGWVGVQRAAYSAGRLDPERARRLEALRGWTWDARPRRTRRGRGARRLKRR